MKRICGYHYKTLFSPLMACWDQNTLADWRRLKGQKTMELLWATTKSAEFLQICILETCHKELGDNSVARINVCQLSVGTNDSCAAVSFGARSEATTVAVIYTKHVSSIRRVQKTFASVSTFAKVEEARGLYTNRKVPYFVTTLKIGWRLFTRDTSGSLNYLCPILVERKSIENVVRSIHDGRWKQCQKERLYQGQYMFGYEDSRMI